jgi:hypothetical protein
MNEEKKLILNMLKEGKIEVNEASQLLDNITNSDQNTQSNKPDKPRNKTFVRILVKQGDQNVVNIKIPLILAATGLKLIPKKQLNIEGNPINIDEILALIQAGEIGDLVNIQSKQDGKDVLVKIAID